MKDVVMDKWGHEIYLTDERWRHIVFRHPDMDGRKEQVLVTLKNGSREENPIGSSKYIYSKKFKHLRPGKKRICVVVQFEMKKTGMSLLPNKFVVTAFQI